MMLINGHLSHSHLSIHLESHFQLSTMVWSRELLLKCFRSGRGQEQVTWSDV